jgi:Sec7-like guanine-nucleotide exchange factor
MDAVKMRQKTSDKQTQSKYDEAIKKFNVKPSDAIDFLIREGLVDKKNQAQDIAFFFVCISHFEKSSQYNKTLKTCGNNCVIFFFWICLNHCMNDCL